MDCGTDDYLLLVDGESDGIHGAMSLSVLPEVGNDKTGNGNEKIVLETGSELEGGHDR